MPIKTHPIDSVLHELRVNLTHKPTLILQAPPGAGKTTRVPLALLDEPWLAGKSILMLEPRRLAASNAARFMARQLGEEVGQTVGYSIRYDRKVSRKTRIEVVTEGILTRRLQNDLELSEVGLVIFDEFHERHLQSDLALALCYDVQQGLRNDLRLLVMSATLDVEPLSQLLKAPVITSEGHSFPVTIHYLPQPSQQQLVTTVISGIHRAIKETDGNLLVFLPGEAEIRRCVAQLQGLSKQLSIRPLYGNLPFAEQEKAILPGKSRKIVLATNIAETSLTIEGISTVIDSGFCRQPRFDTSSGITRLELSRISQASATQRTGRAGRLGPGVCYRLWSQGIHGTLLPFTPPEIRNADLAQLALELTTWGIKTPQQLCWLDPPVDSAWQAAIEQLQTLGAMTQQHQLTDKGKALSHFSTEPRLGCLFLAAEQISLQPLACDLVALLSERDPWLKQNHTIHGSHNDLFDRLEELWKRQRNNDLGGFSAINRASRYWRKLLKLSQPLPVNKSYTAEQVTQLLVAAYPDRIARARQTGSKHYLLASGQGAQLSEHSAIMQPEYLIAVEMRSNRNGETEIYLAASITERHIKKLYPELGWQSQCYWDKTAGRVINCEQQQLGALVLAERPAKSTDNLRIDAILNAVKTEGFSLLKPSTAVEAFIARCHFIRQTFPADNWPNFDKAALLNEVEDWLAPFIGQAKSRNDIQRIDLLSALRSRLNWSKLQQLDRLAPERLKVPSGSTSRLQYSLDGPPVLAIKLQEMFGQAETPTVADNRVAVLIHLLSPAGRPLQITQDLANFWNENYPEIQKEMKGRYPKHPWPDDPLQALPTAKTKRN